VPDRIELSGSNWALFQPDAPAPYRKALSWAATSSDGAVQSYVRAVADQVGRRDPRIADAGAGARLEAAPSAVELTLSYYYGFAGLPSIDVAPALRDMLFAQDLDHITQAQFDAAFHMLAPPPIPVSYVRNHHAGATAVTTTGPFALRFDAAFDSQRLLYDDLLGSVTSAAVEAVAGIEYQTADPGRSVIVELDYTRLLGDPGAEPLLFAAVDTVAVAARARWRWGGLQTELTGIAGIHPWSYVVRPEIAWRSGVWTFRLGGALLGGEVDSFGAYFRRNQGVYAGVKTAL
jgi:hypothetical protein